MTTCRGPRHVQFRCGQFEESIDRSIRLVLHQARWKKARLGDRGRLRSSRAICRVSERAEKFATDQRRNVIPWRRLGASPGHLLLQDNTKATSGGTACREGDPPSVGDARRALRIDSSSYRLLVHSARR